MHIRPVPTFLALVSILCTSPPPLEAQQLRVPDSLVVTVGDTVRPTVTVLDRGRALALPALTFSSADAGIFGATRDGRVLARAVGCAPWRVTHAPYVKAAVPICVVAAPSVPAPAPVPEPVPTPTPDPAVLFASDWSTALGSTREAVTDGERWPMLVCANTYPTVATVVAGAPVGFTLTPNVIRMQQRGPNACAMLQRNDVLPASTTHWGRFYVRNDENGNSGDHPTGYNNAHWNGGAIQAVPWARESAAHVSPGTWRISVGGGAPYPFRKWWGPALQNGVWYRYEWEMRYLSATRFQFWPRVYDAAGTLLYDADDFVQEDFPGAGRQTLAGWLAAGNSSALADPQLARHFGIGHEGTTGDVTLGYWYYARFAFSLSGWIGR